MVECWLVHCMFVLVTSLLRYIRIIQCFLRVIFFSSFFRCFVFLFWFWFGKWTTKPIQCVLCNKSQQQTKWKKKTRPAHIHLKCWYWRADNEWLKILQLMLIKMPVKSPVSFDWNTYWTKCTHSASCVLNGIRPCHRAPEKTKNETAMKERCVCCARETIKLKQWKRRRSGEKSSIYLFIVFGYPFVFCALFARFTVWCFDYAMLILICCTWTHSKWCYRMKRRQMIKKMKKTKRTHNFTHRKR